MQKTHVGLAVGTPNRIEKLLNESGALPLSLPPPPPFSPSSRLA